MKGLPEQHDLQRLMPRQDSNVVIQLSEGADRRRSGKNVIAKKIQQENQHARQLRVREQSGEKDIALQEELRMQKVLDKVHKEHFRIEQWQNSEKKRQMRQNVLESLRMREQIDKSLAENLLSKEQKINKLYMAGAGAPAATTAFEEQ